MLGEIMKVSHRVKRQWTRGLANYWFIFKHAMLILEEKDG